MGVPPEFDEEPPQPVRIVDTRRQKYAATPRRVFMMFSRINPALADAKEILFNLLFALHRAFAPRRVT
jgi:hypothetical protein